MELKICQFLFLAVANLDLDSVFFRFYQKHNLENLIVKFLRLFEKKFAKKGRRIITIISWSNGWGSTNGYTQEQGGKLEIKNASTVGPK